MKPLHLLTCSLLAASLLSACKSNQDRTHDAGLLDDKVTTQRVLAALQRGGPDFRSVKVETTSGSVVLSGTVPSPEARHRAELLAKTVNRVSKLRDEIDVHP